MNFNEINRIRLNTSSAFSKKEVAEKEPAQIPKEDIKNAKLPSNPNYWQGAFGVNNLKQAEVDLSNVDTNKILSIKSAVNVHVDENQSVPITEYISSVLNQKVGFDSESEYQAYIVESLTSNLEQMQVAFETQEDSTGIVSEAYNKIKEITGLGISASESEQMILEQEAMIEALNAVMSGDSEMTFAEVFEHFTGVSYSKEKIDKYIKTSNIYSAVMVGCQYDDDYPKKFKQATGKSIDDAMQDYIKCQLNTFGKMTEIEKLSEKYVQDQQGFKDKLSSVVSTIGICCLAAGAVTSFFCPALAVPLMVVGKNVSLSGMFIDNALDLIDKVTDKDGLTKNEAGDLVLETGVEALSYGVGRFIGSKTNKINSKITDKLLNKGTSDIASRVVGQAAETSTDTALSLGADYAITQGQSLITTGELIDSKNYWTLDRFKTEGRSQLIGILTGIASHKINTSANIKKTKNLPTENLNKQVEVESVEVKLETLKAQLNDTEFETAKTLLNIPERGDRQFTSMEILMLSKLTPEEFETAKTLLYVEDLGENQLNAREIQKFSRFLSAQEIDVARTLFKVPERGENQFSAKDIKALVQLNPQEMETARTLFDVPERGNNQFSGEEIARFSKLSTEDLTKARTLFDIPERGDNQFNAREIIRLSKLSTEELNKAKMFFNVKERGDKQFRSSDILALVQLNDVEIARAKSLFDVKDRGNNQFNGNEIARLARLDDSQLQRARRFFYVEGRGEAQLNISDIIKLSKLNDFEFNKVRNLLYVPELSTRQLDANHLTKIAKLSDSELKIIEELLHTKYKGTGLNANDVNIAIDFVSLKGVENINEIPLSRKKMLVKQLVATNTELFDSGDAIKDAFPLLPKNQSEYCELLPALVRSLGIETKLLSADEISRFNTSAFNLSTTLKALNDDAFNKLNITQQYPKEAFIKDVLAKVEGLSETEKQKVFDYFGFELKTNNDASYSIFGYPANLNNGEKLAQITNESTKAVVESLRQNVIDFSENNKITCADKNVETFLNEVVDVLPELRIEIGKMQSPEHSYDVMTHSLKVMKKIVENPQFDKLSESDQKIMILASMLHDITKAEGKIDTTHSSEGSFDSFFIAKKFNLTKDEEIKLYTLIKHHEWFNNVNSAKSQDLRQKQINDTAYDLRHDNLFELALMFTHADLKSVKLDDSFETTTNGTSRTDYSGETKSYGESAEYYAEKIRAGIEELKISQPILPITKVPTADIISNKVVRNNDGTTNVKGVYINDDGLVVIKYNEVEDWEAIGFPKGSTSTGIKTTVNSYNRYSQESVVKEVDTGNIKFIAHALEYPNQLAKFDAFSLVDSDALLSVSYMERPESKYRLFRPQGVLLDVDTKYIHGGGNTDSGSGYGKDIQTFKDEYIFGAERQSDRVYISDLIKEATGMADGEYVEFVNKYQNKPFSEIEPIEVRNKIIKAFASINSNVRTGDREYNEMYASNPTPTAVFAYDMNTSSNVGNPMLFLNREIDRTLFLQEYAREHNIPFIVFGD